MLSRLTMLLLSLLFCVSCMEMSCMEQYNPRPFWNKLEEEERNAHKKLPELTDDGKLPHSEN